MSNEISVVVLSFALLNVLLSTVGVAGNAIIIIATVLNKHLHTACGALISAGCLLDSLNVSSHIIFLYYAALDHTMLIPYRDCMKIIALPAFGTIACIFCVLCIGLDRCYATFYPVKYVTKSNYSYTVAIFSFIFSSTAIIIGICLYTRTLRSRVVCTTVEIFDPVNRDWLMCVLLLVTFTTVACYVAVYAKLRKSMGKRRFRMFKSLCIVMIFEMGGFLLSSVLMALLTFTKPKINVFQRKLATDISCLPITVVNSFGWLIYYCTSTEYRMSMRRMFSCEKQKKEYITESQKFYRHKNGRAKGEGEERVLVLAQNGSCTENAVQL